MLCGDYGVLMECMAGDPRCTATEGDGANFVVLEAYVLKSGCIGHYVCMYVCIVQRAVVCAIGVQGILLCKGWEVTASQLNLPSLTQLSVAVCMWSTPTGSTLFDYQAVYN